MKKVECANHAVKCYRSHLEALLKDNPQYQGKGGLTKATVKRITAGARSAIRSHSKTGDVEALRHEIRNGPRHCFGDHSKCVPGGFWQPKRSGSTGVHQISRWQASRCSCTENRCPHRHHTLLASCLTRWVSL